MYENDSRFSTFLRMEIERVPETIPKVTELFFASVSNPITVEEFQLVCNLVSRIPGINSSTVAYSILCKFLNNEYQFGEEYRSAASVFRMLSNITVPFTHYVLEKYMQVSLNAAKNDKYEQVLFEIL